MIFSKDFEFLKLTKKEHSKPFEEGVKEGYRKGFDTIFDKYCFSCLIDTWGCVNSDGLIACVLKSKRYYTELGKIKNSMFKELDEKQKFFDYAINLHKKMINKSPSLSLLKVSLEIKKTEWDHDNKNEEDRKRHQHSLKLHAALTKFLNLMRSRAILQRIIGYFWVALRDANNGLQYIHICFYVDNIFNEKLGAEISLLWDKCTNKQGDIINFTFMKHCSNNNVISDYLIMEKVQNILDVKDFIRNKEIIIHDDFNYSGNTCKHDISVKMELFRLYVFGLAKEMYLLRSPPKNKFYSVDETLAPKQPRKRAWGPEAKTPPKNPLKKIRSYGFSRPK